MKKQPKILSVTVLLFLTAFVHTISAAENSIKMETNPSGIVVSLEPIQTEITKTDSIAIRITFSNPTNHAIRFLVWATPFDTDVRYDYLDIRLQGKAIPYVGRRVKRQKPTEKDFRTLAPGDSISKVIDIERAYGLTTAGEYQIRYRNRLDPDVYPYTSFSILDQRVPNDLGLKAAAFEGCSASQRNTLTNDLNSTKPKAKTTYEDIQSLPISSRATSPRYIRWFGVYTPTRFEEVRSTLEKTYLAIRDETITFQCNASCDYLASVDPSNPYFIELCPPYFGQPLFSSTASPDASRAGTIIHEITHFAVVGDTEDHAYFTTDSINLAKNDPARAVNNADNFYFFFENVFPPLAISTSRSKLLIPPILQILLE